jgi:pyruvate/2-oxoglutarate dehydrogenase complex dihydrolipoamide dehydrogenase (E3) component
MSEYDVVVIGGGIAGSAAADALRERSIAVVQLDDRGGAGQRGIAWGLYPGFEVGVSGAGAALVRAKRVILATGSTDLATSFPGSDLPGVMTGSGLREMLLVQRVWPGGKRVALLGDSPLASELAELIERSGGTVTARIDAADEIAGIAQGDVLGAVRVNGVEIETDLLAFCLGRQPEIGLAAMIEAELGYSAGLGGFVPHRSARMETSVPGLYVCGDAAGIGAADALAAEGRLAGLAAAASLGAIAEAELLAAVEAFARQYPERVAAAASIASTWQQHDPRRSFAEEEALHG